jgi:transcriptional regulator with XRE-family HTH domain
MPEKFVEQNQTAHTVEGVASLLAQTRAARNLTLAEVSSQTGLTVSTLSRIENGVYKPRAETFMKVLQWLELSPQNMRNDNSVPTNTDTIMAISLILKSDPRLSPEAATNLLKAWQPMYELYCSDDE